jgi:hypothetical protein
MNNKTYKIDESKVISETIDGETIIINLNTGDYYGANITAAIIWDQIKANNSTEAIIQYFLDHYNEDEIVIKESVVEIIDTLLKDNLIFELELTEGISNKNNKESLKLQEKEIFIKPKIDQYDDMKEMLLADPIHDVNEYGWPNLK